MTPLAPDLVGMATSGGLVPWARALEIWWNVLVRDVTPIQSLVRKFEKEARGYVNENTPAEDAPLVSTAGLWGRGTDCWPLSSLEHLRIRTGWHTAEQVQQWHREEQERWEEYDRRRRTPEGKAQWVEGLVAARLRQRGGEFEPITAWRRVRPSVLAGLAELGLEADVVRTDGVVPLAEHYADLAGLVVVRPKDRGAVRGQGGDRDEAELAYAGRMFEVYGWMPADELPTDLCGFCGQHAPYRRPGYLDHVRAWWDPWGEPVLTAEPYRDALVNGQGLALIKATASLPVTVDVESGLWTSDPGATSLIMFRYDPDAEVLPAVKTRVIAGQRVMAA